MNEFKFRCWNKKENRWIKPMGHSIAFPYAYPQPNEDHVLFGFNKNGDFNKIVWMQFTGLEDKNGDE